MIFVTLGSQKFQFNRILIEIDRLISKKLLTDEIFAQIGSSDYVPEKFEYKRFLDREEFKNYISKSDIIITHGGTGAIMTAVKANKKVIAVPRLQEFAEHVNNHQIQIVENFEKNNIVLPVYDIKNLNEAIHEVKHKEFTQYVSSNTEIINDIENYINNI